MNETLKVRAAEKRAAAISRVSQAMMSLARHELNARQALDAAKRDLNAFNRELTQARPQSARPHPD